MLEKKYIYKAIQKSFKQLNNTSKQKIIEYFQELSLEEYDRGYEKIYQTLSNTKEALPINFALLENDEQTRELLKKVPKEKMQEAIIKDSISLAIIDEEYKTPYELYRLGELIETYIKK
ncbi:MAG: hypothetical protein L0Y61_08870 [Epsilonproteobacteria bacterium]|nr:hypothetical protein [Campylobacterota bacterium]